MDFPADEFPQGTAVIVEKPGLPIDAPSEGLNFIGTVEGYHRIRNSAYVVVKFVSSTHRGTLKLREWYKYPCIVVKYQNIRLDQRLSFDMKPVVNVKKLE